MTSSTHGGIVIDDSSNDQELNQGGERSRASLGKLLMLVLVIVAILVGGAFGGFKYMLSQFGFGQGEPEKHKTTRTYTAAPSAIGQYVPVIEDLPEPPPEPIPTPSESTPQPIIQPTALATTVPADSGDQPPSTKERRLAAGLKGYAKTTVATTVAETEDNQMEIGGLQAKLLKEIDYTLVKGTKIPCTMETNIVSEQSGYTSCVINQDVYSGNARILLLEKGTKVTGQYSSNVKNGDRRLQIIWDRLITPYDIVVQLQSPSMDRLGASGVTGEVDNRWGLRIGSALLVSLISDSINIAGGKSNNAQVIVDSQTSETSQDLAKRILEKNIDLNPIVYIREGEMINIYVRDDINLSSIYNAKSYLFR